MSTPSEKRSVKDALLYVADAIEAYRQSGNHHAEAQAWRVLITFAVSMEESATACAVSYDRVKEASSKLCIV